jgi:hypothetical protein
MAQSICFVSTFKSMQFMLCHNFYNQNAPPVLLDDAKPPTFICFYPFKQPTCFALFLQHSDLSSFKFRKGSLCHHAVTPSEAPAHQHPPMLQAAEKQSPMTWRIQQRSRTAQKRSAWKHTADTSPTASTAAAAACQTIKMFRVTMEQKQWKKDGRM